VHKAHPPYAVGQRYRFASGHAWTSWGEWVVTRIDGTKVFGKSPNYTSETYMVELNDTPLGGEYTVIPLDSPEPDITESFFV